MPWIDPIWTFLALAGAAIWLIILALPWQPWRTRERLEARAATEGKDLGAVTVLIPARNEAETIGRTLQALGRQGPNLQVIVVDDQSDDGTVEAARAAAPAGCDLEVVAGGPLPPGWAGKLWALEQGRAKVETPLVLLLDADIELAPGMLPTLVEVKVAKGADFLSLMAELRMASVWERLLMPAFVYFFKLLYPFHLSNGRTRFVAAAAGGCILTERATLDAIGGFTALKDAVIDDCALARLVKARGGRTWIGLSRSVLSMRRYETLDAIWQMVARSAYTQLNYSPLLLLGCTVVLLVACWLPLIAVVGAPVIAAKLIGALGLCAMILGYAPTLAYYRRSLAWALTMPLIGTLYLAMTWGSALRYWQGRRTQWKGRIYSRDLDARDVTTD